MRAINLLARTTLVLAAMIVAVDIVAQKPMDADGRPFAKVSQQSREPIVLVERVQVIGGYGSLSLRESFVRDRHATAATAAANVHVVVTPLLPDSTGAVKSYAVAVADNGKRIIVKSSSASDTATVMVLGYLK